MAPDLTIVVPACNAESELPALLAGAGTFPVIVVDDASADDTAAVATAAGAQVIRVATNGGPANARNLGWRAAQTPFVVFVDVDASIPAATAAALDAFRSTDDLALVAPRIRPRTTQRPNGIEAYEAATSAYDLGDSPGAIGPDEQIRYLTSAVLFARVDALRDVEGFDATLRFGEDLDLLLRIDACGWRSSYLPEVEATHQCRRSLLGLLRLHFRYGVPHGLLARRHKRNRGIGPLPIHPSGWVRALRTLLAALVGAWLWLAIVLAMVAPGSRAAYVGAIVLLIVLRHGLQWRADRPAIGPIRFIALRLLDSQASAAGLWFGSVRAGTLAPVLPRLTWRPR